MKLACSPSHTVAQIEGRILDLLRTKQRLMFQEIANALPEYTWHDLLSSLARLRQRQQVELVTHRWDYEIVRLSLQAMDGTTTCSGGKPGRDSYEKVKA